MGKGFYTDVVRDDRHTNRLGSQAYLMQNDCWKKRLVREAVEGGIEGLENGFGGRGELVRYLEGAFTREGGDGHRKTWEDIDG